MSRQTKQTDSEDLSLVKVSSPKLHSAPLITEKMS